MRPEEFVSDAADAVTLVHRRKCSCSAAPKTYGHVVVGIYLERYANDAVCPSARHAQVQCPWLHPQVEMRTK